MTISSSSSAIPGLPENVLEKNIFANLPLPALGTCSLVCKAWNKTASKQMEAFSYDNAFGPKEWYTCFGVRLKNVPRLPQNITEIISASFLLWPNKKVDETRLLALVPETVNGQPFNLKLLGELVKKPLTGNPTQYKGFFLGEYTDPDAPPSHWVLLSRDVIEGSRGQSYKDQQALLAQCSQKDTVPCEVPKVLDATVCIVTEYVRFGTRLYSNDPFTWTRCQEKSDSDEDWQVGIGCYTSAGLHGNDNGGDSESSGVAGSWKL
jgi:hypothetical protein